MKTAHAPVAPLSLSCSLLGLLALSCGGTATPPGTQDDPQAPPQAGAAVDAWLAKGLYKSWRSEPSVHDARSPSPHGKNRIYSNTLLSAAATGEYPVGSASVKELYDAAGAQVNGYAVYLHTKAGDCNSWYYYETQNAKVVADGAGVALCVGCHSATGSDAGHSGHDCVYTQVK